MSLQIDAQLQELSQKLVLMGRLAQTMIELSLRAFAGDRGSRLEEIASKEEEVGCLQMEIDSQSVKIAALYHPVGADIRFLFMAPRIAEEIERIAGHAVKIKRGIGAGALAERHAPLVDLRIMGEVVQRMLGDVIDALIGKDGQVLDRIGKAEDEIDAFRVRILSDLTQGMSAGRIPIPAALAWIAVSRSLERIGDHATNIGMEISYIASGRDARHVPVGA